MSSDYSAHVGNRTYFHEAGSPGFRGGWTQTPDDHNTVWPVIDEQERALIEALRVAEDRIVELEAQLDV